MEPNTSDRTMKPFAETLGTLLRIERGDTMGRYSLRAFLMGIEGWHPDTLRKMVKGDLTLQPDAIEAMAAQLGKAPSYFREYRLHEIEVAFSRHPELEEDFYEAIMGRAEKLDRTNQPDESR